MPAKFLIALSCSMLLAAGCADLLSGPGATGPQGAGPGVSPAPGTPSGGTISAGPYTVSTFVGSTLGSTDGKGTAATFFWPSGIVFDKAGNAWVTDRANCLLRKITPAGDVTTIAGSTRGFADGKGTAAKFNNPDALAIASDGTLYVADTQNHKIRRVTPDGEVTTVAGSTEGNADGPALEAQLKLPGSLCVVGETIFFTDHSGKIKKLAGGTVSTWTTSGVGLYAPGGLTLAPSGRLYLADGVYDFVHSADLATGVVTKLAGGGTYEHGFKDGKGEEARFSGPGALVVDAQGNVAVCDKGNGRIRRVAADGTVTTIAGGAPAGFVDGVTGLEARFSGPSAIAMDAQGRLYVCDAMNNRIRLLTPQ